MLVASILKVFYWFGTYYSPALLIQSVIMIGVQVILLKVALDNRPTAGARDGIEHSPFSDTRPDTGSARPYNFWQWRNTKPYWMFLVYFTTGLLFVHVLIPPIARSDTYIGLLGYVGLAVEATLPLPQILANHRSQSCRGFRVSVIAAWIIGDIMKMSYFFFSRDVVPWAFRLCGMFQCVCDLYLGAQFWMYTRVLKEIKDFRMT